VRLGHRTPGEPHPAEGLLAKDALAIYGFAPLHPVQWIFQPGMPPCLGIVDSYRVYVPPFPDGAERDLTSYVVSATVPNCARGQPGGTSSWAVEAWAVGADEVDASCNLVTATTRRGSMYDDEGEPVRRIEPVPATYRKLVPPLRCHGRCLVEWNLDEIALWEPVAHLKITKIDPHGAEVCDWPTETTLGTYVVGQTGPRPIPDPPAMALVGAFVHTGEPKLLLYRDTGVYAVRTLEGPTRKTYFFEHDYRECAAWDCCCGC
jgi:hypothetical protein